MQPFTTAWLLAAMAPMTGYCGPGPERMLSGVVATATVAAAAGAAMAKTASVASGSTCAIRMVLISLVAPQLNVSRHARVPGTAVPPAARAPCNCRLLPACGTIARVTGCGGMEREVDLLVAGAGAAGMTAALVASLEGLDVLVCEKSEQVGGTARPRPARSGSPATLRAAPPAMTTAREDADALSRRADRAARRSATLRDAFLQTGPAAIDYLEARSEVQFLPCGPASRLPQQPAGRRLRRPRHRSEAVRRPPVGRGFQARPPADRGIHGARRHDGRQGRHPAADRALPLGRKFRLFGRSCCALSLRPPALRARHAAS